MAKLPEFYVKHDKGHTWDICGNCGLMVMCGTCNNNCCNGGHGEINGKECPDCSSAYDFQSEHLEEAEVFYEREIKEDKKRRDEAETGTDDIPIW